MERGDSLRDAAGSLDPKVVPETDVVRFGDPARICFNVNTPADVEEAERIFAALRA